MNYKIAIDPGHGGSDFGNVSNNLIEKELSLLISNYIKGRLDTLGIPSIITRNTDRFLSDSDRINVIESAYGNDTNVIVISNHLNKGGEEGAEIVYSLRDNDKFASEIAKQLSLSELPVNKYYQLRDSSNTSRDFYTIIRDTPNYETVYVSYGYVDNNNDASRIKRNYKDYAEAVVRAIAIYTGNKYVPIENDYYVVVKGDTLYKIANKYGVTVDDLKKKNNLTSNLLNIGQVLIIPSTSGNNLSSNKYIVKSGDTLYKIANKYGVTIDELKKVNNLTSDLLSIGQILFIPDNKSSKTYIVKSGDTLYKIAKLYGVSVDEIKRANNLANSLLSIGQVLVIP